MPGDFITSRHEVLSAHFSGKRSLADLIQQWGNHASITLLDPACKLFMVSGIEGVIGYRIESGCAVVFGDPVCSLEHEYALVSAFHAWCAHHNKNVVYVAASQRFMMWTLEQKLCAAALGIGDEIILDPQRDPKRSTGKKASLLRNKHNQAVRDGITVREYIGYDALQEEAIDAVRVAWLNARTGPQIHLFQINLFSDRINKRLLYAQHAGTVTGVLLLNRVDRLNGWVINILMVLPDAHNSTSEFLVLSALDLLRSEGCRYFSVGTTPAQELGALVGVGKVMQWLARRAFKVAKKIFQLGHRQRYWKKFYPKREPTYLLFKKASIGLSEILGIMRALNVKI